MGTLPMLLMLVALGGMYFFMNRSQKKQQEERKQTLDSMKPGDEVVTIGGLHGVISGIDNEKRTILIDCEGIFLEFDRAAIKTVKPGVVVNTNEAVVTEPAGDAEVVEATETTEETKPAVEPEDNE